MCKALKQKKTYSIRLFFSTFALGNTITINI